MYFDSVLQRVRNLSKYATELPNLEFLMCYLLGWVSGLVMLNFKRGNRAVGYHAWQSIIIFAPLTVLLLVPPVVFSFISVSSVAIAWLLTSLYWLIFISTCILWIYILVTLYRGENLKLGPIGRLAVKFSIMPLRTSNKRYAGDNVISSSAPAASVEKLPSIVRFIPESSPASDSMVTDMVNSINTLYRSRDPYTASHQERVAQLACAIAREMGYSEDAVYGIKVMALMHDIGKIAVPGEMLSKAGQLNDYELGIIRQHPVIGYNAVKELHFRWPVAMVIFQHHERLNGSGYPRGICGEEILWQTRILSVSDVVEAMATHRPYRPALGVESALEEITVNKGKLYDPDVVDTCVRIIKSGEFNWVN